MDPYHILGIQYNATQDEIKQAYRRLAMKWHPDRNQNSSEAKEQFHLAAEAYKILFDRAPGKSRQHADDGWSAGDRTGSQRSDFRTGDNASQDDFAESVFWDVMLDYAIKLAQTGKNEHEITIDICRNGCSEQLAGMIAEKAFNIHAHYASNADAGKRRKTRPDRTSFKQERLERDLYDAFLGQRSYVWSPRDAANYYQVVFRGFAQSDSKNPLTWISVNRRLMRILNFSIVLFAVILLAVYYYPGPAEYKLLSDRQMLQLPFLVLPLMFVWMLYRKLWLVTLLLVIAWAATINYYNSSMPEVLPASLYSLIPIALVCFAPFVFAALFANFLYYLKAQRMVRQARTLFADDIDQLVWVKNRSGTSATAAFLFAIAFIVSTIHLFPRNWNYNGPIEFSEAALNREYSEARLKKIRLKTHQAREFFEIGETHFNALPPTYASAGEAYRTAAAKGSLLAAYKLGYMHYTGEGAEQDDVLAFDYFLQATRAPLAFQPHNLELTTSFLAESYNNLGIMYQHGLGTRKNRTRAAEMFQRAIEFGSPSARQNLERVYQGETGSARRSLVYPEYR